VDPVTLIVTAVVLGASAGLRDTADQVVKDAYAGLKRLLQRKGVEVGPIERNPDSAAQRAAVDEQLTDAGAASDADLIEAAKQLITLVRASDPSVGPALGLDFERIEAEALRVRSVESDGTAIRVRDGKFTGAIDIGDIRAGGRGNG
jgi:hypothetical protein